MPKPPSELSDHQVTPNPKVEKRTRRHFSTEYKLRILAEADACRHGELGELLRREKLYSSPADHLAQGARSSDVRYRHLQSWLGRMLVVTRSPGTSLSRIMSRGTCTSILSTCPRCPMSGRNATCTWPSTERLAGCRAASPPRTPERS